MAKIENYTFDSCDEVGTKIHAVKWTPDDGKVRAAIELNHGMIEYIERYSEFAEFLADRGFAVFGHDHIGHGESVSDPSDLGNLHTDTPSDTVIDDMFTQYKLMREQYPSLPCFILGHSMGSYLLRKMLSVHANDLSELSGAIIMGTGTEANIAISIGTMIVKSSIKKNGRDFKDPSIVKLMFGPAYKNFDITGEEPEKNWLSKNVESVKKYYSDPKDTFMFSVNGYLLLLECTKFDNDMKNIKMIRKDLPILFVSGADDPVGGLSKGVSMAYQKFVNAGIEDVTLKLYENDRHELLQETDRERVFEDIYTWMEKRL